MQRVRRRDTAGELALRRRLHTLGLRYFVDRPALPGSRRRVDVLFPKVRLACFYDSWYWHGCPEHGTSPKTNSAWWEAKLAANRIRDEATDRELRAAGWEVIRVWQHEDLDAAANRIRAAVLERR
jgi:DNA mismatch endonuclease (patch repair protein)